MKKIIRQKEVSGFAKRLKRERENREMFREQVAKLANISPMTLTKIENGGARNPSITTVMDIANSLGIKRGSLATLLGDEVRLD